MCVAGGGHPFYVDGAGMGNLHFLLCLNCNNTKTYTQNCDFLPCTHPHFVKRFTCLLFLFSDQSISSSKSLPVCLGLIRKLDLFQLFDKDNHVNKQASRYLFSTEGHLFPVSQIFREKHWKEEFPGIQESTVKPPGPSPVVVARTNASFSNVSHSQVPTCVFESLYWVGNNSQ